ncbi:ABC transporter permease [Alkaliphilus pronyensis]|nr:ABC-2 family transporter protein [Alkaliphilus pronyensis]
MVDDKRNIRDNFFKYLSVLRIASVIKKAYILDFIGKLIYLPINLSILYLVWYRIFQYMGIERLNDYSLLELYRYYYVVRIVGYSTSFYKQISYKIWNDITYGEISKFLCRPISYLKYQFFYGLGYIRYNLLISVPLFLIGTLLFRNQQLSISSIIFFLASLSLSIITTFFFNTLIGLITFWTEAIFGVKDLILHVGMIFSGALIPLEFLPRYIALIGWLLPFNSMVYIPVSIGLGNLSEITVFKYLLIQLVWIIILASMTTQIWSWGQRRYEAQGG